MAKYWEKYQLSTNKSIYFQKREWSKNLILHTAWAWHDLGHVTNRFCGKVVNFALNMLSKNTVSLTGFVFSGKPSPTNSLCPDVLVFLILLPKLFQFELERIFFGWRCKRPSPSFLKTDDSKSKACIPYPGHESTRTISKMSSWKFGINWARDRREILVWNSDLEAKSRTLEFVEKPRRRMGQTIRPIYAT